MSPLRLRMWTQPADDWSWMHFWFTRQPNMAERVGVSRAVYNYLAALEHDPNGRLFQTIQQFAKGVSR